MLTKNYISDIDLFLKKFDAIYPKSSAQQAEIAKYQQLNKLRDIKSDQSNSEKIWQDF